MNSIHNKYWFKCDKCYHNFSSAISNITSNNRWCPYCSIPCQKICNDEICDMCFNKSFASYKGKTLKGKLKLDCFNYEKNKNIKPREIIKHSHIKYWFKCDECDHDFNLSIGNLIRNKWCPYCCHNPKLCNAVKCKYCYSGSIASFQEKTSKGLLKIECWNSRCFF